MNDALLRLQNRAIRREKKTLMENYSMNLLPIACIVGQVERLTSPIVETSHFCLTLSTMTEFTTLVHGCISTSISNPILSMSSESSRIYTMLTRST